MDDSRRSVLRSDPALRRALADGIEGDLKQSAEARAAQKQQPPQPDPGPDPPPTGAVGEKRPGDPAPAPLPDLMEYTGSTADNRESRKRIEARLQPMDFGAVLSGNRIEQEVPIHPSALIVSFHTITNHESVQITQKAESEAAELAQSAKSAAGKNVLYQSVMNDYTLAAHLAAFNGRAFLPLSSGDVLDMPALVERLTLLRRLPNPVVELLQANFRWFLDRVVRVGQDLEEHLGNG